ncbi:signal peptidase II [Aminipila luticellarii]|uniref:Lipoprotein signal peptidase n=1 Tax=Aminipila luticellarii TaxID=2507160 RepID=A0A410PW35_9FIRM|nr:signal peptidase II [Aminipila luticellarii]QAT43151.1 signal peptidase II [Aminipila luticellarii]
MYYIVIIAAVMLDQLVKYAVRSNMDLYETIPVIDGIFHITYIQNTGAAFSMFSGHTGVLALITAIITIGILVYLHKLKKTTHWLMLMSLSLIVAGGVGNIADRIFLKYVVDFLDLRIWPIFNLADVYVCCGCGLLILYIFFVEPKLKGQKDV